MRKRCNICKNENSNLRSLCYNCDAYSNFEPITQCSNGGIDFEKTIIYDIKNNTVIKPNMENKTVYTAPEGSKITSVEVIDNRVVVNVESVKKTWIDYVKDIPDISHSKVAVWDTIELCKIMFVICTDLNKGWEYTKGECIEKLCYDAEQDRFVIFTGCDLNNPWVVKRGIGEQLLEITGDEFLRKLWGIK